MGQEIADLVLSTGADGAPLALIGFIDDDRSLHGREILGVPVLGGREWLSESQAFVAIGVGAPAVRRRIVAKLRAADARFAPALVHPYAHVGLGSEVADGTVIACGAILTADVRVGVFAIVNAAATVSHNARLADYSTVAPGAHLAGNVTVGEGSDIGIGASVVQGTTIGEWSIVGAGAAVIGDVEPTTTVVGCPARVVASRSPGWQE